MKRTLLVAIAFLFLGLIAVPALATTYYVATNGNDNNTGTEASPWKTVNKANTTLVAGDTVMIKAGTYTTSQVIPNNSGTSSQPITYRNYGTDSVTLNNPVAYGFAILLDGKSYVVVQGLNFTNYDYFLYVRNSANHNTIANCTFHHPHLISLQTRTWAGSRIYLNSDYLWVHDCTFKDYGYFTTDDMGSNFDVGNENTNTDTTSHMLFENNLTYNGGHHCMGVYSMNCVIRNNYFHHEVWELGDAGADRGAVLYGDRTMSWAGYSVNSGRNLFEGNRVAYSGDPPDQDGSAGMSMNTSYNIVRKNYYCHNNRAGISMSLADGYKQNIYYNKIYNNTVFHNGINTTTPNDHANCGIFFAYYASEYYIRYNALKNNLLYANHNNPFDEYNQRTPDRTGIIAEQTFANNWTSSDPLFVNASTTPGDPLNASLPDMTLQSSSPCRDQGGALTTVTSSSGSGTTFTVADAGYFMDGWGITGVQGDVIQLLGTSQTARCTSVNYSTNTITVNTSLTWTNGQGVCLSYLGTAPDAGAYELPASVPSLSINDVSTTEGNIGTKTFAFTVSMSGSNPSGASVNYATAAGTATAGTDYVTTSGTLTWTAGNTSPKTINVTVNGDTTVESNETFYVNLSNPSNATISDSQGLGTIQNDDGSPIFADNFDNWTVDGGNWTSVNGRSGSHTLNTTTSYAKAGTKSIVITDTDTVGTSGAYLRKDLGITGNIYVRFYVYLPTGFTTANATTTRRLLRIWGGPNRGQFTLLLGAIPKLEEVGAWGATSGSALSENVWHCIEVRIAPPTSSTILSMWIDGTKHPTDLTANFSATTTWDYIELGDVVLGSGGNGIVTFYIDEAVVNGAYIGPIQ